MPASGSAVLLFLAEPFDANDSANDTDRWPPDGNRLLAAWKKSWCGEPLSSDGMEWPSPSTNEDVWCDTAPLLTARLLLPLLSRFWRWWCRIAPCSPPRVTLADFR